MNDIRRTILWVVFSMSLVLLWDAWNRHQGHPSMFAPVAKPAEVSPAAGADKAAVPAVASNQGTAAGAVPDAPASSANATAESLVLTTDLYKATFSTQGGTLTRLELLKHTQEEDRTLPVVLFDQSAQRVYLAQTGLISADPAIKLPNHLSLLKPVSSERELKEGQDQLVLKLASDPVDGVRLIKTFTFKRGDYTVGVRHEVVNEGAAIVKPQLYLQLARDGNPAPGGSSFYSTFTGPAFYSEAGKYQKVEFSEVEKGNAKFEKSADNGWVAMVQHYFVSAWLVNDKSSREFRATKVRDGEYSAGMVLPLADVALGSTLAHDAILYAGPQEESRLEALSPGLELVKDYGWLTMLAKPLFWLLNALHGLLGNWGWSIVALVVILKAAFFWLNASAYKSMAKMKAINPRIQEMRERLKDKPQQMQQEMMRMYREEKVNPLGGCLPIFIQMPFFIALYWVLLSTVEMRQAPWLGWIVDLSVKDPYFILPLVMTASTMLQTWLNPTPPDPLQAKMMWIMPLAFSVMFFFFPAGLVLYWVTNNILSIAQQWVINKKLGVLK
jgi:YidC/Oxa1 family membrane protein insertase